MGEPADTQSLPESAPSTPGSTKVEVRLGRYTVRGLLGRGGMGEVFLAHDPDLDRRVAVKVIRAGTAARSPEARARFQREAQAMARLNHPNVVAVYDVGVTGDTTYVAIEYIDGPNLAEWLRERPRALDDVLDVMVQAGRGLAAAHAAGLVHRDFKPSNVMLGERVRVVDFGLARADETQADPLSPTLDLAVDGDASTEESPLEVSLTAEGRVLGTPTYMAPEQRAEQRWGAAADQYSFGVTVYEAVTGRLPGAGEPPRPMPSWLRPAIDRALAPRPEDRFRSMDDLLAALTRARPRTRARVAVGAGAALVAGVAAIVVATAGGSDDANACAGAGSGMAGVWDDERRATVEVRFAAAGTAYSHETWDRTRTSLDAYERAWADASVQACRATRVERRQSEAMLVRQTECLERARAGLVALTRQWMGGLDSAALVAAPEAAKSLPTIAACLDTARLERTPPPRDPEAARTVASLTSEIDRLRALFLASKFPEVSAQLPPIVAAADATGWSPIRAEAHYLAGRAAMAAGLPEAEAELLAANRHATDAGDDRLAAVALVYLVKYLAGGQGDPERALSLGALAETALSRAGNDPALRVLALRARTEALVALGRPTEAKESATRARDLALAELGANRVETFDTLVDLAEALQGVGERTEARRLADEGLAGFVSLAGQDHPMIASALSQLSSSAYMYDDYEAAAEYLQRASEIVRRTYGEESMPYATAMHNLASIGFMRGQIVEAEALFRRSLAIRERTLGPEHPLVATSLQGVSGVLQWRGELDEALALLQRALAILTKEYGPDHPDVGRAFSHLGSALASNGKLEEALTYHRRALVVNEGTLGGEHPDTLEAKVHVAETLQELGRCKEAKPILADVIPALEQAGLGVGVALEVRAHCELAGGDARGAVTTSQRAITACEATSPTSPECATMYWVRARALAKLGKRAEAIAAAEEAERRSRAAESPEEADEIRAWIERQRR
jgi:tetratricopeptide (TPR) repeat protein/predicted Ser/Thr protein kinase